MASKVTITDTDHNLGPCDSVDTDQAARRLGVSKYTLKAWRRRGIGPAYYKLGRRVTYLVRELDAYRDGNRHNAA